MRIDCHQHFWQYNPNDYVWMSEEHKMLRGDFLPEDLKSLLDAGSIHGTIAVQARQMLSETDFLLELANRNPFIKGVVGWIPLCIPEVQDYLDQYADNEKIVGFRHVVHDESDDDFILRRDFNAGINNLSRYNLCYDILIFEKHLPQAIQFVDMHPTLPMVVDHIAKPNIHEDAFDQTWANNMRRMAERGHVYCKLSGMVTEVRDKDWNLELLSPYFDVVLEAFGPKRLMFGSDWPVCLLRSKYLSWLNVVTQLIDSLSVSEKEAIMGGNAAAFYLNRSSKQ
jgi:L-fuconolactonase